MAFSLIELLTVISIIGILAAMGVGVSALASRKMKESRVRAELQMLVTAIESYKAALGQYPPDNNRNGTNYNPALNSLYYELMGTLSTNEGKKYRTRGQAEWLDVQARAGVLADKLNLVGFVNSSSRGQPKQFLSDVKSSQKKPVYLQASDAVPFEVLVVPVEWPVRFSDNPALPADLDNIQGNRRLNPWRYVSTQPTNNPEGFDLWAEVIIGKRTNIIGNWKE